MVTNSVSVGVFLLYLATNSIILSPLKNGVMAHVVADTDVISPSTIKKAIDSMVEQKKIFGEIMEVSDHAETASLRHLKGFENAFDNLVPYFKDQSMTRYLSIIQAFVDAQLESREVLNGVLQHISSYVAKAKKEFNLASKHHNKVKKDFERHPVQHRELVSATKRSVTMILNSHGRLTEMLEYLREFQKRAHEPMKRLEFATNRLIAYRYLLEILSKSSETYMSCTKLMIESVESADKIAFGAGEVESITNKASISLEEAKHKGLFKIDINAINELYLKCISYRDRINALRDTALENAKGIKNAVNDQKKIVKRVNEIGEYKAKAPEEAHEKMFETYNKLAQLKEYVTTSYKWNHASKQSGFTIVAEVRQLYDEILKILKAGTNRLLTTGKRKILTHGGAKKHVAFDNNVKVVRYEADSHGHGSTEHIKLSDKSDEEANVNQDEEANVNQDDEATVNQEEETTVNQEEDILVNQDADDSVNQDEETQPSPAQPEGDSVHVYPVLTPSFGISEVPEDHSGEDVEKGNGSQGNSDRVSEGSNEHKSQETVHLIEEDTEGSDGSQLNESEDYGLPVMPPSYEDSVRKVTPTADPTNEGQSAGRENDKKKKKKKRGLFGKFKDMLVRTGGSSILTTNTTTTTNDSTASNSANTNGTTTSFGMNGGGSFGISLPSEIVKAGGYLLGEDTKEVAKLVDLAEQFKKQFDRVQIQLAIRLQANTQLNLRQIIFELINTQLVGICESILKDSENRRMGS